MAKHNDTGHWGEQIARDFLAAKGYAIADSNWKSGHYELDIIAYNDNRIVFVEVKTRSGNSDPLDAVNYAKKTRLIKAGLAYVDSKEINHEIQFDLIAINGSPDSYTVEHIVDAFQTPLKTY